jgi:hypothetical protein
MDTDSILPPIFKGVDELSRRECRMKVIRKKLALLAVAATVYICVPLLLTSYSDVIPRRRINQPTPLQPPLNEVAASSDIEEEWDGPLIAWLMSFPNSGTSYTMRLISRTSQTLVATNYQKTESSQERQLHPVYSGHSEGPFWPDPDQSQYNRPPSYVLTKTHCGSRCNDCGPYYYLKDSRSFQNMCASGSKLEVSPDGTQQTVTVGYNTSLVHKAIHLIRNPFDNVVSRFHLERHRMMKINNTEKLARFPESRQGFRSFCRYMDDKWKDEVEGWWLTDEIGIMRNIPCRDDFFRYIVWHNLAFDATDNKMDIPTYILHYEDYSERFNETVTGLLNFLDLQQENDPYPFHKGHTYLDYFTPEEKEAVKQAMKIISIDQTWHFIQHYFT